jgi:hypothetical protein
MKSKKQQNMKTKSKHKTKGLPPASKGRNNWLGAALNWLFPKLAKQGKREENRHER